MKTFVKGYAQLVLAGTAIGAGAAFGMWAVCKVLKFPTGVAPTEEKK